jgi:murein DD-endopeptidase MepM/ murein hydrolase activator NlpD
MKALASARYGAALLTFAMAASLAAQEHALEGGARAASASVLGHWSAAMTRHDVRLGRVDPDHDDDYVYRLPYAADRSFPVIQSYGSRLSHRGAERFTVDFGMPRGAAVHAARAGTVVLVEDSHVVGCELDECSRFANFVVVLHDDGTTGEYFHLEPHTAAVRRGERVRRGQLLARSGNTGFSTAPHLHFGVYRTDAEGRTESLPVSFSTRSGTVGAPRTGARYSHPLDR